MKVALAQMLSGESAQDNVKSMVAQLEQAALAGARVVIFPENCLIMYTAGLKKVSDDIENSDKLLKPISDAAQHYNMTIILGTVPVNTGTSDPRVKAATLVYDPQGQCVARYDKIHLFDASIGDAHGSYRESDAFAPGQDLVCVQVDDFCFGLSICYDLRFPLLYQQLRLKGADVLICPAAFTQFTGEAHWEPLLRARAIENQCYMLGINQGGWHSETRETYGNTMAIDPWGQVMGRLGKGVSLLVVDVSKEKIKTLREQMPVFDHRKPL